MELQAHRLRQEAAITADLRGQLGSASPRGGEGGGGEGGREAAGGRRLAQAHAQMARLTDALEKEQARLVTSS